RSRPNTAAFDEQLSAYLDDRLAPEERAALEAAIASDPDARAALAGMRQVREDLAGLGEVRAPRPFTLVAPARPVPGRASRFEFATRIGAVVASLAFVLVFAEQAVAPREATSSARSSAQAPQTARDASGASLAAAPA